MSSLGVNGKNSLTVVLLRHRDRTKLWEGGGGRLITFNHIFKCLCMHIQQYLKFSHTCSVCVPNHMLFKQCNNGSCSRYTICTRLLCVVVHACVYCRSFNLQMILTLDCSNQCTTCSVHTPSPLHMYLYSKRTIVLCTRVTKNANVISTQKECS